ncbi:MAG: hypothetical protein IRY95_07595, partial [Clostridia bacterium]|nr:hypothetical protein [Clostridia bacterium]
PYVYERSALHRQVWREAGLEPGDIRSLEDFQSKVPCIDKDRIRRFRDENGDPFGGLLCVPPSECTISQSSGTTGDPTFAAFTDEDIELYTEMWCRAHWALGPDERGLRPGEYCLTARPAFHSYAVPLTRSARRIGAAAVMVGLDAYCGPQIVNYLRLLPISTCFFMPAPIVQNVRQVAEQRGLRFADLCRHLRAVGLAGEVITEPFRRRMEGDFGIQLFITGGSTPEVGTLFSECGEKNGYVHLHGQDISLSEVTDPVSGRPVPPGTVGEHTVTNFSFRAMPVLRYKTDDLVVEHPEPACPFGRTAVRLKFLGREQDRFAVGGRPMFVSQLKEVVEVLPGLEEGVFQVIKTSEDMDRLRLRVGYDPRINADLAGLETSLQQAIDRHFGVAAEVVFTTLEELRELHPYKVPRIARE